MYGVESLAHVKSYGNCAVWWFVCVESCGDSVVYVMKCGGGGSVLSKAVLVFW